MKNFTKILLLFLLIIASNQTLKAQEDGLYYEGTINGNLKIQMYLEYTGKENIGEGMTQALYEGWYYYESQGPQNKLTLTGGHFQTTFALSEKYDGQVTGYFDLSFNAQAGLEGTWRSQNGAKTFPVVLKAK